MGIKKIIANKNTNRLFRENIKFLNKKIEDNNTDFILILPNRKLIKNIRNEFLKEKSVICDVKIWTFDDLVSIDDISDYTFDLLVRIAVEELIKEGEFKSNNFFESKGLVSMSKNFISAFKYSNKKVEDIKNIKIKNESIDIMIKIYEKYNQLTKDNKILDKFDYYNSMNLNLGTVKDIYIHGFSELRPIEINVLKKLVSKDINITIFMDYYSDYKKETFEKLCDMGFECETQKDINSKSIIEKVVKTTNEIVEYDRLINEILDDSKIYKYSNMAILIEKDESKREIINKLKEKNIPIFDDDYVCYKDYKIFSDLVNLLDVNTDYKSYVMSALDVNFLKYKKSDKILLKKSILDYEFNNIEELKKILKYILNYEINTEIVDKIESYRKDFSDDNDKICEKILEILSQDDINNIKYKNFADKIILIVDDLLKSYTSLLIKLDNINEYLIDIIKNLKLDKNGILVDGIKIYNLNNIRLNDYDILYIINANDDVIPGRINTNFFINDENISILKQEGVDILSDSDNKKRNIDRFLDAYRSTNKKIYISYNTNSSVKSRLVRGEKLDERNYLSNIEIKSSSHIEYSFKDYLNNFHIEYLNEKVLSENIDDSKVQEILNQKLSSTKLETYFTCPMRFYFKYIMNLKSYEKIRHFDIGNILHKTLEDFYSINIENIKKAIDDIEDLDMSKLDFILKNSFESLGLNIEIKENKYDYKKYLKKLEKFIANDIERMKNEKEKYYPCKLEEVFDIKFDNEFEFYGKIDRVDMTKQGDVRLIDYKTKKNSFKNIKDLEKNSGFQFAVYQAYPKTKSCMYMSIEDYETYEFLEKVTKKELTDIVIDKCKEYTQHLLDKDFFISANDKDNCRYCEYNSICTLKTKDEM